VIEAEFEVASELGLHARPAGEFAATASQFASEISVMRADASDPDDWVSGRSVLSLLGLAASRGTRLRLRAEGPDAEAALAALGALLVRA
jgi:phosphotransferase system HPr (HPr) family protein